MLNQSISRLSRRHFLRAMLVASPGIALAACTDEAEPRTTPTEPVPTLLALGASDRPAPEATVPATAQLAQPNVVLSTPLPTPACDDDEPTPPQTAGPFYTPNTPQRNSFLEPGITGVRMIVTGYVLDTTCRPIPGAMLDFWHCDDAGVYDNIGYRLRGHFFTDAAGRYTLETIQPGIYPGRTRHFHVRVQAPNQPVLTTQLYFPKEPFNARDAIFRPECIMNVRDNNDGSKTGNFNFVLKLS